MSLSLIDIKDEEIIAAITAKYEHHHKQASRYKSMLEAYGWAPSVVGIDVNEQSNGVGVKQEDKDAVIPHDNGVDSSEGEKKVTYEGVIIDILKDLDRPLSVSDLHNEFFARTKKTIQRKDFASKLSMRAKHG